MLHFSASDGVRWAFLLPPGPRGATASAAPQTKNKRCCILKQAVVRARTGAEELWSRPRVHRAGPAVGRWQLPVHSLCPGHPQPLSWAPMAPKTSIPGTHSTQPLHPGHPQPLSWGPAPFALASPIRLLPRVPSCLAPAGEWNRAKAAFKGPKVKPQPGASKDAHVTWELLGDGAGAPKQANSFIANNSGLSWDLSALSSPPEQHKKTPNNPNPKQPRTPPFLESGSVVPWENGARSPGTRSCPEPRASRCLSCRLAGLCCGQRRALVSTRRLAPPLPERSPARYQDALQVLRDVYTLPARTFKQQKIRDTALAYSKFLFPSSCPLRLQLFPSPELEAELGSRRRRGCGSAGHSGTGCPRGWFRSGVGAMPLESPERGPALGPRAPGCDCAAISCVPRRGWSGAFLSVSLRKRLPKREKKKIQLVLVDEPLSHVLVGGERKK